MSAQTHFDTSRIIKIYFRKESPLNYVWAESKYIVSRFFFGLFEKKRLREAGWYRTDQKGNPYGERYTTESLSEHYTVYPWEKRINGRVCEKPCVWVYLIDKCEVSRTFESDQEANEWIDYLKSTTTTTFEIVNYP